MRVTRTSRGTLEVLLDAIRTDDDAAAAAAAPNDADEPARAKAWDPRAPLPGPDATGQ
jgi:hypothetical protein